MTSALLIPHRFAQPEFDIEVTLNGTTETLRLDVVAGRDYWVSGDGIADGSSGDGDVLALFAAALNTHTESGGDIAVSLDAQKRVVVDTSAVGADIILDWGAGGTTLDPALFGFEGSTVAAQFVTSPNRAFGWWLPGSDVTFDSRDRQPVLRGQRRSMTGRLKTVDFGATARRREVSWTWLLNTVALTEYEVAVGGAFEGWYVDHLSKGSRFRLYPDAAVDTFGTYTMEDPSRDPLERMQDGPTWNRWQVRVAALLSGITRDAGATQPDDGTAQGFGAGSLGAGSFGA